MHAVPSDGFIAPADIVTTTARAQVDLHSGARAYRPLSAKPLPQEIWEQLVADMSFVHAAPGEIIHRPGRPVEPTAILSGIVLLSTRTYAGRQAAVCYAERGELIGLVPRLSGSDTWEARAVTAVTAALLPLEHIETLGHRRPELLLAILTGTAVWAAAAIDRVARAAAGPIQTRVARQLLYLAVSAPDGRVVAPVTHQLLADTVGTSREVVTRALGTFRSLGLVATARDGVDLNDPAALARRAGGA
jgi:CRP-like cAMP-binding protein